MQHVLHKVMPRRLVVDEDVLLDAITDLLPTAD